MKYLVIVSLLLEFLIYSFFKFVGVYVFVLNDCLSLMVFFIRKRFFNFKYNRNYVYIEICVL